jgi:hypothetical protein
MNGVLQKVKRRPIRKLSKNQKLSKKIKQKEEVRVSSFSAQTRRLT